VRNVRQNLRPLTTAWHVVAILERVNCARRDVARKMHLRLDFSCKRRQTRAIFAYLELFRFEHKK
jgi:hypothetical protein